MRTDLISRNKLYTALRRQPHRAIDDREYILRDAVLEKINIAPSVDAVEVVHGRWETNTSDARTRCSVCKVNLPGIWYYNGEDQDENYEEIDPTPFCPNCGAKMDGGATDG